MLDFFKIGEKYKKIRVIKGPTSESDFASIPKDAILHLKQFEAKKAKNKKFDGRDLFVFADGNDVLIIPTQDAEEFSKVLWTLTQHNATRNS